MINLPEKLIVSGDKKFLLRVENSDQSADYQKYENLRQAIWEFADDHLAGTRNLMCENFCTKAAVCLLVLLNRMITGNLFLMSLIWLVSAMALSALGIKVLVLSRGQSVVLFPVFGSQNRSAEFWPRNQDQRISKRSFAVRFPGQTGRLYL